MAAGGVDHQSHLCRLLRMRQGGGGGEGVLGRLESCNHLAGPGHRRLQGRAAHQGVVERPEDGGGGGDEPAIKIDGAQEGHELLDGAGLGVQLDGGEAAVERRDAGGRDMMSQKIQLGDGELALLLIHHQAGLAQAQENFLKVGGVLLCVGAGDEDVVQVGEPGRAGHHTVHEALESVPGVAHPECHPCEFEEAKRSDDGGLRDVGGEHGDLVIALPEVNLGEDGGSLQAGDEIHHIRQGIAVRDGDAVEAAIIAARAPAAIRLADHVERRCPRAIRAANDAVFLQGGELGLGGGELLRVQAPEWRGDGRPRGPQVMQDAVGGVGEPLGGVEHIPKLLEEALDCWTVPGGGGRGGVQPCRRSRSRPGRPGRCWTVPGGGGRGGVQPCRR